MRKTLFFVLLLAGGRLWASQGIVETTDGKAFEGEIRLECGGVVISDTNQHSVRVELANLQLVRFQIPVAEGIPTPTGRTTALDVANVSRLKLPAGIQLTKIESRPSRAQPWDYVFYLDFDGDPAESPAAEALALMRTSCAWMHTLSRAVAPRTMTCLSHPGLANQTTESSVTATTSSLPSPSTSAVVTA